MKNILSGLIVIAMLVCFGFADPPNKTTDHGQGNTGNGNMGNGVGNLGPGNQGNGPNPNSGNTGSRDHGGSGGGTGGGTSGGGTSGGSSGGTSGGSGGTSGGSSGGSSGGTSGGGSNGGNSSGGNVGSANGSYNGGTSSSSRQTNNNSNLGSNSINSNSGSNAGNNSSSVKHITRGPREGGEPPIIVVPHPPMGDSCDGDPNFDRKFLVVHVKDGQFPTDFIWWRQYSMTGCPIVGWFWLNDKHDTLVFVDQEQGRKLWNKGIDVHYDSKGLNK